MAFLNTPFGKQSLLCPFHLTGFLVILTPKWKYQAKDLSEESQELSSKIIAAFQKEYLLKPYQTAIRLKPQGVPIRWRLLPLPDPLIGTITLNRDLSSDE